MVLRFSDTSHKFSICHPSAQNNVSKHPFFSFFFSVTYVVCCTFPSTLLWPVWNVNGLKPLIPWHHVVTGKTEEDLCWLKHEKWRFSLNGHEMKSSCCHQYILNICTQKRFLDSAEGLRATSRFCAILLR